MKIRNFQYLVVALLLSSLCAGLFIGEARAEGPVNLTAVGTASYKDEISAAVRKKALEDAKLQILKKYMARQPAAKKSVYSRLEEKFRANLDGIISNVGIQKEKDNTETKRYSVLIKAVLDSTELERLFNDLAGAGSKLSGDFGALFLARVESSRKSFDVKRTKIRSSEGLKSVKETSLSSGGKSVDAVEAESFSKKQTGGSSERKRDKVSYKPQIELTRTLQEAIGEMLVNAGFTPMEYTELEGVPMLDELMDDEKFRSNGMLPTRLEVKYRKAAQQKGWKYWGLGTVSIGTAQQDPVRGNMRLSAEVSFKVYQLSARSAKTIATVRKKTVTVNGDDLAQVETLAANKAAKLAIDTVVGQLQKRAVSK
jgi:hypothetical protein